MLILCSSRITKHQKGGNSHTSHELNIVQRTYLCDAGQMLAAVPLIEHRYFGSGHFRSNFSLGYFLPRHAYNGKLSCFFAGTSTFLSRSIASARAIRRRVECGMMTSSI